MIHGIAFAQAFDYWPPPLPMFCTSSLILIIAHSPFLVKANWKLPATLNHCGLCYKNGSVQYWASSLLYFSCSLFPSWINGHSTQFDDQPPKESTREKPVKNILQIKHVWPPLIKFASFVRQRKKSSPIYRLILESYNWLGHLRHRRFQLKLERDGQFLPRPFNKSI